MSPDIAICARFTDWYCTSCPFYVVRCTWYMVHGTCIYHISKLINLVRLKLSFTEKKYYISAASTLFNE